MTELRIAVFSDTHGDIAHMEQVVHRERPDLVLHLGDLCRDFEELQARMPSQIMQNVCGNCDGFTMTPDQRILQVEGKRILMTHGHRYHVKSSYTSAVFAAREAQADILLFGHTHIACCEEVDGLWLLNPGACQGWRGTYGLIELSSRETLCRIQQAEEPERIKKGGN